MWPGSGQRDACDSPEKAIICGFNKLRALVTFEQPFEEKPVDQALLVTLCHFHHRHGAKGNGIGLGGLL
jgi:hypothetical protein